MLSQLLGRIHYNKTRIQLLVYPWVASSNCLGQHLNFEVIMESLVKKKQKGAILELKRRHLKNTIFCTYTPYPTMKIRRISYISAQETRNDQFPIRRRTRNELTYEDLLWGERRGWEGGERLLRSGEDGNSPWAVTYQI
ncbi:hypothetical protein Tco_0733095 [Tanacetum coccineum]